MTGLERMTISDFDSVFDVSENKTAIRVLKFGEAGGVDSLTKESLFYCHCHASVGLIIHLKACIRCDDVATLRAQYLENYLSCRHQVWCAVLYREWRVGAQIIFPESGRGIGHVTLQFLPRDALLSLLQGEHP